METGDREIIEGYFKRMAEADKPARDPEAEKLIAEKVAAVPGAAYYLAQAAIASEHAMAEAQNRIQHLEWEAQRRQGGMLGSLFGGGSSRPPQPVHAPGYRPGMFENQRGPWGGQSRPSFMVGAMQMMMGVAGGMLLGNLIGQMLGSNEAAAAEMPAQEMGREEPSGWDAGGGDGGGME